MAAPTTVRTRTLAGERLRPAHVHALAVLLRDPRVAATMGGPPTAEQLTEIVARHVEHWRRERFGQWMWRHRATGDVVARGGLQRTQVDGRAEVEVAWAVVPEHWGQGLATELGRASVRVAFERLGLSELVAVTLPHNVASRRVMEKLGFAPERDVEHAGLAHVLYRLRR